MKHANKIRVFREKLGLNQTALASISGVGVATINRLENYDFNVRLTTAEKIAKALGVEVSEVFPFLRNV